MAFQLASSSTQNYSSFYDEAIEMNLQKICCCCLSKNTRMVGLQYCRHADFLINFSEMDISRKTVCLLCHSMLEKIKIFRKQVIDSTTVLQNRLAHIVPTKLHKLQTTDTKTTSKSGFEDENTTEEVIFLSEFKPASLVFETEVKIEHTSKSSSESDDEPPLCIDEDIQTDNETIRPDSPLLDENVQTDTKKKRTRQSAEDDDNVQTDTKKKKTRQSAEDDYNVHTDTKKRRTRQSAEDDDKYKGKILIYHLTRDELEKERDIESQKETYLKLPYKCKSCIKGFDHEVTLMKHNDKQHREKKGGIKCDVCETILAPLSYKEHKRRHYRRLQCAICGKRSHDIYCLSQHFNQEHSEAGLIPHEFQCTDCEFSCSSNRAYRYHRDKHKQKSQCTECGNTFVNATTLRVHMLNVHDQTTGKYKCSQCDKSYCSKSGLFSHRASAHSDSGAFCVECKSHFRTKHGLAHHLSTHSKHVDVSRKRYHCAHCDAKFTRKTTLQEHIDWIHLNNVTNQCSQCDKVFKCAKSLKKHVIFVHEKKRPPRNKICDYCGRGFTTIPILRNHIRTHTGERPLNCSQCDATFAHSASLYTHSKLVHKQFTDN